MASNAAIRASLMAEEQSLPQLLQRLETAAGAAMPRADFVTELLQSTLEALAALETGLWLADRGSELLAAGHAGHGELTAPEVQLPAVRQLVESAVQRGLPRLVMPQSGDGGADADENPGASAWLVAPLVSRQRSLGCLWAAVDGSQTLPRLRQKLEIAAALAAAALPFFEREEYQQTLRENAFWRGFAHFCQEIHTEPGGVRTPQSIVQEAQRITGADRVWLLTRRGRRFRAVATSGVAAIQGRANAVQTLERLTSLAGQAGQSLRWESGAEVDLAPQLQTRLNAYLDESPVRTFWLEPVARPPSTPQSAPGSGRAASKTTSQNTVAALVCEWFRPRDAQEDSDGDGWKQILAQTSIALQNADDWRRAPLAHWTRSVRRHASVWRWLGTALATAAVAGTIATLCIYPADLTVEGRGELQPVIRRHVFANAEGIVKQIHVATGDQVAAGQILIELRSPDLDIEYQRIQGSLEAAQQRLSAIESSRLEARLRGNDDLVRLRDLSGQLEEVRLEIASLQNQQAILKQRRADLQIVSPIAGEVLTWDVSQLLQNRPVTRGQRLITVADSDGGWQLEVRVDDEYAGDLQQALTAGTEPVRVDYILATAPDTRLSTQLKTVSTTAEERQPGEGATLLATAPVPAEVAASARAGLGVRSQIYCGRASIAYVWLRDVGRLIQQHVLFRLGW